MTTNKFTNELACTLIYEAYYDSSNFSRKNYKEAILRVGRNEFNEIYLKLAHGKLSDDYPLKEFIIHKKFLKEGKATIAFEKLKIKLLISNCPPDHLATFLKTLEIKTHLQKKELLSNRNKLISSLSRKFTELSPISVKDIKVLQNIQNVKDYTEEKTAQVKRKYNVTPKGKENINKNITPTSNRVKKQLCLSANKSKPSANTLFKSINSLVLTNEQQEILDCVLDGHNVFFTGSAGTGKSYLLTKIIGALPPDNTFVTASTGIAACHIRGTTIHAFAGIGTGEGSINQCIGLASRSSYKLQWKQCQHLIIDEISMIDGDFFNKLEIIARTMRNNSKPFGGMQLIVSGDFHQLPPVSKIGAKRSFAFQCQTWSKCFNKCFVLKKVHRQADENFVRILNQIRIGICSDETEQKLKKTIGNNLNFNGILATRLCTHKEDVENINKIQLNQLKGSVHIFQSIDNPPTSVKTLDNLCPVQSVINLKIGAQIMLTKNIDVQKNMVNGARGVIIGFQPGSNGPPIVKFLTGENHVIKNEKWSVKGYGGITLQRQQLPIKLAWAISIHKSQGMTLDCVEISLLRVFEPGQTYVALSRAKNLEGLKVLDFEKSCVKVDPLVLDFYKSIDN